MSNWKLQRIGEVVDIRRGSSPRPIDTFLADKGMPWVKISDATASNGRYIFKTKQFIIDEGIKNSVVVDPEDLIISNSATPALPKIMKIKACVHDGWLIVSNYKGITRDFLYYSILYYRKWLINQGNGSIFKNLKTDILKEFKIKIPSINIQDRIVSILKAIEDKIELNNQINTELEEMAKTIYDYWFVQFDFPDKNGKPYKSSGGKMVWNEELKKEIPESWSSAELNDIANIVMGQSPPGDSYNDDKKGIVFYQGCTDFGNRFPTVRKFTTQPTRYAKEGDILLSVRAPVGSLNIAKEDCCIGRGLAALNSKDGCIAYLFGVMINLKQIFDRRNVDGTTFGSITKDDLFSLKVVRPMKEVLEKYNEITNPAFRKQNNIALENQKLTQLRDWILPMLMNGQVKVL